MIIFNCQLGGGGDPMTITLSQVSTLGFAFCSMTTSETFKIVIPLASSPMFTIMNGILNPINMYHWPGNEGKISSR